MLRPYNFVLVACGELSRTMSFVVKIEFPLCSSAAHIYFLSGTDRVIFGSTPAGRHQNVYS